MDVSNGNLTAFEAVDASGWRLNMNATNSVPTAGTLLDRHGNQYQIQFDIPALTTQHSPICSTTTDPIPVSNGDIAPLLHLTPDFTSQCNQGALVVRLTDGNGNLYQFDGATDTMGRQYSSVGNFSNTSDLSGCASALPISSPAIVNVYSGPNGTVNQIKTCFSLVNIQTNFGVPATREWPIQSGVSQALVPVTIILPDGSKWTFSYDSYGNVTSMGLPLGGTISYQWGTAAFPNVNRHLFV
jgi:YD repeat-containing protein